MKKLFTLLLLSISVFANAQIGIGTTNPQAMFDITSTTGGLLIPRLTSAQRDAIPTPPAGLQVFNTTDSLLQIYIHGLWQSVSTVKSTSNLVYINTLSDLPAPSGSAITLNAAKVYVFSGFVDISPYYLNLNGAGLQGTNAAKDGIISNVSGAILRSTDQHVSIAALGILPSGSVTKGYDFSDATGTKYCLLLPGCSVVESGTPGPGVGQISGFKMTTIAYNLWNCTLGLKVTGNSGRFSASNSTITGITSGSGIEFLTGLTIDDIDLTGNYFNYTGQTGVKVNTGTTINRGRMSSNMFRNVGTLLSGFDSYTPGWGMYQNTNIPNTRAFSSLYMNSNTTSTSLPDPGTFYKIAGATVPVTHQRFDIADNKFTYVGKESITSRIMVVIGAKAPANDVAFSIAIAKNGVVIPTPNGSMAASGNNQNFQITFNTEVDLSTNDYIEVFIRKNNSNTSALIVSELQFRVND